MSMILRTKVVDGRVRVDAPIDVPDGVEVEVAVAVPDRDDLDEDDRARLHAALEGALDRMARGEEGLDPRDVIASLRQRLLG
jgi:hypothetical protein